MAEMNNVDYIAPLTIGKPNQALPAERSACGRKLLACVARLQRNWLAEILSSKTDDVPAARISPVPMARAVTRSALAFARRWTSAAGVSPDRRLIHLVRKNWKKADPHWREFSARRETMGVENQFHEALRKDIHG